MQAADATFGASQANRLDVLVTLTAEIARNYFELRGSQNQLAVAQKNANVQTETLKITQARLEGGRGTQFDVVNADPWRQKLAQLTATHPSALGVYLGKSLAPVPIP